MATKNVLGRIAAIVSVNTASVRPTLNASVKDIEKYATTVRSRISGATKAAGRAFDDIFTPLQKLQAALKAANQQPLDLKIQNSREILQAVRAAEQIAKPLTDARKQFSGLSQEVQATLLPVLQAAQKQTTQLFDALSNGAKVSDRDLANTEARVRQLIASLRRASEASSLTRGLATGQEVQFQNPEFVEQARRAAQLQQQASSLTASQLSGSSIVNLIGQQRAAADEAERLRAALDKVRTTRNGDAQAAQAAYSNQLAQLAQINNRIELQIDLINRSAAAIRSAPQRQADNEIALLIRREQAAKEIEDQRQAAAQRVADNEIAQLIRREQAAKQIEQQRLAGLERVADNEIALLIRREQAAKEAEDRRLAAVTRAADNEIAALIRREQAARNAATGGLDFGLDLDAPARQIEILRGSVVSLNGQLDTLPAGIRAQFIPAIQQAEANLQRLAAQPAATAAELRRAARELELLNQGFNRARQASNIQSFRGFTESLATRGALGELQALQQILSRIQAQAGGPAAQAYDRYAAALRRAVTNGTTQLPQVRRRLEELQIAAARAAAETGRISFDQSLREIRRGGDIARGGFDRVSLAVQQAAFAIDDFFSSTGDFTQRIRAVQNNVTQLAFILGGTRGLFIGLGVAIAAQATVALINWVNGGRTAEDQTRALNDALARQKSLVEELAQAFESLGDTIADRAFSESARAARSFSRQLEDIQAQQRDLRQERLAAVNPNVQRERAEQNRISRALDDETNVGRRIILERELEQSRRRERQIVSNLRGGATGVGLIRQVVGEATLIGETFAARLRNGGTPTLAQQQDALTRTRQEVFSVRAGSSDAARRSQVEALRRASERLVPASQERFFGFRTADAGRAADRIREIEALIRRLEDPVQQALDDLAINLVAASQTSSRAIEQAQSAVAEAILQGVPSARILDQQLNTLASQLESAFNDLERSRQPGLSQEEQSVLQSQAERRIRDITGSQQAAITQADALRRELTLNPDQQIQDRIDRSLQTLQSLSSSGFDQPDLTEAIREIEFQRETLRQQSQLFPNDPVLARAAAEAEVAFSQQVDAISQEVEVRRRLVEQLERERAFDEQVARRRDPEGDAVRGLDLFDTPAQRAAREAEQGILDIAAAFDEQIRGLLDASGGLPNADILAQSDELRRQRDQAAAQFAEQQQRAAAPAIFNLADSVENAILQGPSRAALNASDISTQEGARELNRLLRGEDSARDQNLVELQNQSQELRLVNQRLTEVARQVGVAL